MRNGSNPGLADLVGTFWGAQLLGSMVLQSAAAANSQQVDCAWNIGSAVVNLPIFKTGLYNIA